MKFRFRFRSLAAPAVALALCIAIPATFLAQSPTTQTPPAANTDKSPTAVKTTPTTSPSDIVGQVFQIEDLKAMGIAKTDTCGSYFTYTKPEVSGEPGVIMLVGFYQGEARILSWASDKFRVKKVDGLKQPKVKILRAGGPVYPWGEITISPEHYTKAACLAGVKIISWRPPVPVHSTGDPHKGSPVFFMPE